MSIPKIMSGSTADPVQPILEIALGALIACALILALGIVGNPWYHIVRITSGSMAPTIQAGDAVLVAPPPTQVRPGMIVVMSVGDEVVTHRVVSVSSDGGIVTKGDANRVTDDWGGEPVRVVGRYVATVPWAAAILPIPTVSAAMFTDRVAAAATVQVGVFTIPPVAAAVRVQPDTVNVTTDSTITAFVDSLADPHHLPEIDLSSIKLCYMGQCITSAGAAKLQGSGHVTASFEGGAFARIIGSDTGSLELVVQGKLVDGDSFRGTDRVGVMHASGGNTAAPTVGPSPTAPPTPTPSLDVTPTPTASSAPSASASPYPAPTGSPGSAPASPTPAGPTPTPSGTPTGASPTPSASTAPGASGSPSPAPTSSPGNAHPSPTPTGPTPTPSGTPTTASPTPSGSTAPSPTPTPGADSTASPSPTP